MWILTESWNLYDQQGDYFIDAWAHKPTLEEVTKSVGCSDKGAEHILNGGGRIDSEQSWYNFFPYKEQQ